MAPRPDVAIVQTTLAIRCLIIDDNLAFLDAARKLLEQEGATVVGVASTGEQSLRAVAELRPDVTLIDIDLGPESGFSVAQQLVEGRFPGGSLILISTHQEHEFTDLIEASPVIGFIGKSALSVEAIERLLNSTR